MLGTWRLSVVNCGYPQGLNQFVALNPDTYLVLSGDEPENRSALSRVHASLRPHVQRLADRSHLCAERAPLRARECHLQCLRWNTDDHSNLLRALLNTHLAMISRTDHLWTLVAHIAAHLINYAFVPNKDHWIEQNSADQPED